MLTTTQQRALRLYRAPFRYDARGGYIWDADNEMVSDDVARGGIAQVRGWGRMKYLDKPEQLQDAVGELIALALTEFWQKHLSEAT